MGATSVTGVGSVLPCVAVYAPRDHARAVVRRVLPRRRVRLVFTRTPEEFERAFRRELVDAAVVDVEHAGEDTWRVASLAAAFPSAAFFGITPYRGTDGPAIARCAVHEFADVLADGIDDSVARTLVVQGAFSTRFARSLAVPPEGLGLNSALQRRTWSMVIAAAGRPLRTDVLARAQGLTREHLSRKFGEDSAPNLKRVMDLVRVLAAAELSKNPGYDVTDVARVLDFASPSHLATTAHRIAGARPASLARLRATDLIRRFSDGRGRSRS